jgi:hypothetical protein
MVGIIVGIWFLASIAIVSVVGLLLLRLHSRTAASSVRSYERVETAHGRSAQRAAT